MTNGLSVKTLFILILSLVSTLVITGCSSKTVKSTQSEPDAVEKYNAEKSRLEKTDIISPGNTIRIQHTADASLSGEYKVSFKGWVRLPLKVSLVVGGLSTEQASEAIEREYRRYFKVKNNVNVFIAKRDYDIEVRGLVQKPGIYTVKLDTSLEEIIAMSGGVSGSSGETERASGSKPEYVRIVRSPVMRTDSKVRWIRLTDYFLKYDVRNENLWRGGEQLFFQVSADPDALKQQRNFTVQVMGEVNKPGEYPIQPGLDLYTYLAQAGGPTATADLSAVTIIQKSRDDSETVDLSKSTRVVDLAGGDVILIKSTQVRPGFFERLGPLLVSVGSLGVSIILLILAL